ncbi:uncharacterized protein PADG_12162 [Paracoccidioides brasiliensis Pb18]|uniref:Uncharacterized protein n=2 Tax=Paracoccidioides brasiliensis TaxID=121759 RepID=A0A0A0HUM7_PARBD|nr:uncharacterized protein PADG_12162 [Paracoccidioides brasiliensis Pb18]KGM91706.1 hypothetical protein PADG_12162 [Paracoccidioides brasiliensis Pb18]ODH24708.1 hypothetical protein ACO22_05263 [Paracoccidioides brasiliensis]ODH53366.1 hypothetical protein GX48_00564 [Paracoccidioides brasiliensis]
MQQLIFWSCSVVFRCSTTTLNETYTGWKSSEEFQIQESGHLQVVVQDGLKCGFESRLARFKGPSSRFKKPLAKSASSLPKQCW